MTSEKPGNTAFQLHTASGVHALDIAVADSFWRRFRGLMLAKPLAPSEGLLLLGCDSVHCAFMRQSIDVIYLDAAGVVLKCVPELKPWRASMSQAGRDAHGRRHVRARHTLELAAGSIARLGIAAGDRAVHPALHSVAAPAPLARHQAQRGAALVEFVVVGPLLTLIGLGILQYTTLFFAKNQLNHASFVAARAGSLGNANVNTVRDAYIKALVPLYGGGTTATELAESLVKATKAYTGDPADPIKNPPGIRIELINPTKESFADFGNNPDLQHKYNTQGKRVIRNASQAFKGDAIGSNSGQTIQDANLIKLRITHGYEPKIPLVKTVYQAYLKAGDPKNDAFYTTQVQAGRIPVVTNVTLHMQSDAIEGSTPISTPGAGNNGTPTNPGDPPDRTTPPPTCTGIGCNPPPDPVDPGTPCTGTDCPVCPGA
jgi:uncharacterized membrane protein (UPF0127 family)